MAGIRNAARYHTTTIAMDRLDTKEENKAMRYMESLSKRLHTLKLAYDTASRHVLWRTL